MGPVDRALPTLDWPIHFPLSSCPPLSSYASIPSMHLPSPEGPLLQYQGSGKHTRRGISPWRPGHVQEVSRDHASLAMLSPLLNLPWLPTASGRSLQSLPKPESGSCGSLWSCPCVCEFPHHPAPALQVSCTWLSPAERKHCHHSRTLPAPPTLPPTLGLGQPSSFLTHLVTEEVSLQPSQAAEPEGLGIRF